jgi:hypothetical protein
VINRLVSAALSICLSAAAGAGAPNKSAVQWIERPWEYRYLLQVDQDDNWAIVRRLYIESLAKDSSKSGRWGEPVAHNFDPQFSLALRDEYEIRHLNVLRLDINQDRSLVQRNLRGDALRARLNRSRDVVLTPNDERPPYIVAFGFFFMGAHGASDPRYSPAICSMNFGDSTPVDGHGRYAAKFDPWRYGYFGCREWAAQLYDKDRPYIDVTSYETIPDDAPLKKGKKPPLIRVTYIRPFVGFSRFSDAPKPVIGNHKGTWYCVTDCPEGDAPGAIADMKAWAKRSGWAMPAQPKNVREFMDTPIKAGGTPE